LTTFEAELVFRMRVGDSEEDDVQRYPQLH